MALLALTMSLLPEAEAGWVSTTSTTAGFALSSDLATGSIYRLGMVTTPGTTPTSSDALTTWSSVSDGNNHGCGLQTDNTLWCWGTPLNGELGITAVSDYLYAKKQPGTAGTTWSQVSSGYGITCGIRTTGALWCWGTNGLYQLGLGADTTTHSTPANTSALTTWKSVSVGPTTACALKTDGTIWCWGDNANGQLGTNDSTVGFQRTTPTQVANPTGATWTDLSIRGYHACAQDQTNAVYCWGRNDLGQLGNGTTTQTKLPGTALPTVGGVPWRLVRVGITSTCGIRTDGKLYCWGQNANGQLGVGDTTDRSSPTLVLGGYSNWTSVALNTGTGSGPAQGDTCGSQSNGTLWCWGLNDKYQLGLGDTTTRTSPVEVGTDTNWSQVEPGVSHACAVKTTGTLWCWGNGLNNQFGMTVSVPTQVGLATTWQKLAPGRADICLIRSDGTLWCSDYNQMGQLGQGDTAARITTTQVGVATTWKTISMGGYHACGTKSDGTLWCWGDNTDGELGQGDTTQRSSPTQVGAATDWAQVSAGVNYNCATKAGATLYCWGLNNHGQLGNGNTTNQYAPVQVGVATNWARVSSVYTTSCAVRTDGTLYCWGDDSHSDIGDGGTTDQSTPTLVSGGATNWSDVEVGRYHTCALRADQSLYCWGSSNNGQLGQGDNASHSTPVKVGSSNWRDLAVGAAHTCGIQTDSTLWCWGFNGTAQLGLGDINDRNSPTQVTGVHSRNVTAGWYMTFFTQ